jgi:ribosomal-protein-alanine N-acetyltransferase
MTIEDVSAVYYVDRACFKHNWTEESYQKEIQNVLAEYIIAEINGKIIAFGGFWGVVNEAQITNIGVLPTYQRQGIGKKLLNELIRFARESGCNAMTLEVRSDNEAGIKLYQTNGFCEEGIRKNYYDNCVDALIMWRYNLEE